MRELGLANKHRGGRYPLLPKNKGLGKIQLLTEDEARELFNKFKDAHFSLRKFGKLNGFHGDGLAKIFNKYFPDEYDLLQEEKSGRRDLNYKRGRSFEYATRNKFRARGWWVLRSPQSKSPVDLVAIKTGKVFFIQCKSGGVFPTKEREILVRLADSVGATPVLVDREGIKDTRIRKCTETGYEEIEY
jgi:Holliday junction resolvase